MLKLSIRAHIGPKNSSKSPCFLTHSGAKIAKAGCDYWTVEIIREIAITQHTLQPPLIPEIKREHPVESCGFWGVSGRRFPVATEHLKNGSLFFFLRAVQLCTLVNGMVFKQKKKG